jgi:hypothetical protein
MIEFSSPIHVVQRHVFDCKECEAEMGSRRDK